MYRWDSAEADSSYEGGHSSHRIEKKNRRMVDRAEFQASSSVVVQTGDKNEDGLDDVASFTSHVESVPYNALENVTVQLVDQLQEDNTRQRVKIDTMRASLAVSERTIVKLQEALALETKANNFLREKVASLGIELQRARRGSILRDTSSVDLAKLQIATLKKDHENEMLKQEEEWSKRLEEEIKSAKSFALQAEKASIEILACEQRKHQDCLRVLEWERSRSKELSSKNAGELKDALDNQRMEFGKRLAQIAEDASASVDKLVFAESQKLRSQHVEALSKARHEFAVELSRMKAETVKSVVRKVHTNSAHSTGENDESVEVDVAREQTYRAEIEHLGNKIIQCEGTIKTLEDYIARISKEKSKPSVGEREDRARGNKAMNAGSPCFVDEGEFLKYKKMIDFHRGQAKKAKSEFIKLRAEKRKVDQDVLALQQENSIWAQDVQRLKNALAIVERKCKKTEVDKKRAIEELSQFQENAGLWIQAQSAVVPSNNPLLGVDNYQAYSQGDIENAESYGTRPLGLGAGSYAAQAAAHAKQRSHTCGMHSLKKRSHKSTDVEIVTSPSISASKLQSPMKQPINFVSPQLSKRRTINAKEGELGVDNMAAVSTFKTTGSPKTQVLLARPRDISALPKPNLSPPKQSSRRRSPVPKTSPKKDNIAFGQPLDLDALRDSHQRAHPKIAARAFFDQQYIRSKLSTADDVASAERRRLQYAYPSFAESEAQTPNKFHGALAVINTEDAVIELEKEQQRRLDTLQLLEWERVRHNESIAEEKSKLEALVAAERTQMEEEKTRIITEVRKDTSRQLEKVNMAWEKKLNDEVERTKKSAELSIKRAQEKFKKSRAEYEKKDTVDKESLRLALKQKQEEHEEAHSHRIELLGLVQQLDLDSQSTKQQLEAAKRKAELVARALDSEREASSVAKEAVDGHEELIDIVKQLEVERDDAKRRFAIAQEALKRERKKESARHWKPSGKAEGSDWKGDHLRTTLSYSGSSEGEKKKTTSPFLRRGAQQRVRKLASGRFGSASSRSTTKF